MSYAWHSPHRRDDEGVRPVAAAIGPALGDLFQSGPELQPFGAVLVGVTEARTLPPAEAMVGDRHGNRHVDADHADIDAGCELARGMAVASDRKSVVAGRSVS